MKEEEGGKEWIKLLIEFLQQTILVAVKMFDRLTSRKGEKGKCLWDAIFAAVGVAHGFSGFEVQFISF